jgi:hypothetical protein
MADQDRRNQNADKSNDRNSDNAGGITNRPLADEIDNQEALPERGTTKDETRTPRKYEEGDTDPAMPSDDATLNTKI